MPGRILIVDDVATNRIVYKVKLAAAFYDPLLASDGAACLHIARTQTPSLILLDLNLPDMSAIDVLKVLRSDPVTALIPVVVLSAQANQTDRLQALAAGADDFLDKSVNDQTLLARLRNLLRGHEVIAEFENDDARARALGFAEGPAPFEPPGEVALVACKPETALRWRRDLAPHLTDRLTLLTREEVLADTPGTALPDVYVIEVCRADPDYGLRLMSDLHSRSATRHAAVCLVHPDAEPNDAVIAFDLGADDLMRSTLDPSEFGLRLRRVIARKRLADRQRKSVRDGLRLAVIDPLTGLYNRRFAVSRLASIAAEAQATGAPFAVMVIDLDRFKRINDDHGHAAGDAVLVEVARRLSDNLRSNDLLARIGGEEFLVALPGLDLAVAGPVAERLCQAIREKAFDIHGVGPLRLSASIGLAACETGQPQTPMAPTILIERADQALLAAKANGRNKVTIHRSAA